MKKEIREKRHDLYRKSLKLRDLSNSFDGEKSYEIRKKQDEIYNKWKFYNNIIKADDKINKQNI